MHDRRRYSEERMREREREREKEKERESNGENLISCRRHRTFAPLPLCLLARSLAKLSLKAFFFFSSSSPYVRNVQRLLTPHLRGRQSKGEKERERERESSDKRVRTDVAAAAAV
jgi:hypothetical protein